MKLKTKLKDMWINLEATIILIGKRDQKEKEFNKTEIGKQLDYSQDITTSIMVFMGIFVLGLITTLMIMPKKLITAIFLNSIFYTRFLFLIALGTIIAFALLLILVINFTKYEKEYEKWDNSQVNDGKNVR
jgi:hypothetical protein